MEHDGLYLRKTMFLNAKSISRINPSCPMCHVVSSDFGFMTVWNLNRNKFPNLMSINININL